MVLDGSGTLLLGDEEHPVRAGNVVARLEGSDPVLKDEAVVITAHFDHGRRDAIGRDLDRRRLVGLAVAALIGRHGAVARLGSEEAAEMGLDNLAEAIATSAQALRATSKAWAF